MLAWAMYTMGTVCTYCVATYAANIVILLAVILLYKRLKKEGGLSVVRQALSVFSYGKKTPDQNAVFLMAALTTLFICANVLLTTYVLKVESDGDIQVKLKEFYAQLPVDVDLPPGIMVYGKAGAPVKIDVFTDFLCTACYKFHQVEDEVVGNYGDQVSVSYYNFPLDKACNRYMQSTPYPNSCLASRAALAAEELGVFEQYAERHYRAFPQIYHAFDPNVISQLSGGLAPGPAFINAMNSGKVVSRVVREIDLARRLDVSATPTLFINGRRFVGSPGKELLEKMIETEISRARIKRIKERVNPLD